MTRQSKYVTTQGRCFLDKSAVFEYGATSGTRPPGRRQVAGIRIGFPITIFLLRLQGCPCPFPRRVPP
jgi:hypothetical protein